MPRKVLEEASRHARAALDNVSLWKKGIAVVSIPLIVLLITLVLMSWHERVSRKAQDRVRQSLQVKAQLYQVQAALTDSETAVRGYMLWRDPIYLAPYNEARVLLPDAQDQLDNLLKDNVEQTSSAKALREATNRKLEAMRMMLENPRSAARASNPVTIQSYNAMLEIRRLLNDMAATEASQLNNRTNDYDKTLSRLNAILIALFVLAILGGVSASYIVSAGILSRVHELELYARKVSRGQSAAWQESGQDELSLLGRSVQVMTNNLLAREEALHQTREQLQKANVRLRAQLRETQAANEELESFSYSVSHDLRAPLRHITGFADLMQKNSEDLTQKNQRYLGIITDSVHQMGQLIDELLAFSRLGRTSLSRVEVDLNEVVGQVLTDFSAEITNRSIEWKIETLPTVSGDAVMLRLVFQNLIDNAVKYTRDRDPAIIEIRSEPSEDPTFTRIIIRDNGAGFDEKYADKLFSVFQRLHNAESYEGSGIGLATVRRIINRHGGEVSAMGALHKGATFTVDLPKSDGASRTN